MILFALAFLLGDSLLQTAAQLPPQPMLLLFLSGSFFIWLILRKYWPTVYLLPAFFLGLSFSAWFAQERLAWSLPQTWEGQPLVATGYIASLPVPGKWGTRFLFAVEKLQYQNSAERPLNNIQLTWNHPNQVLHVGDQWRLPVRLKHIHGSQSPGAFDFEAWALQRGVRASGSVLTKNQNPIRLQTAGLRYPIDQWREALQNKISAHLPQSHTAPWLMALIIGERQGIAQEDWQILRNTGTNHLMAIAGLHIGIMSGLVHTIATWCWRRIPYLVLRFPAMQAGACAALITALLYSALAGFSIPTQRACLMLSIFILTVLNKQKINAWHSWALAMLLVLLCNPLSVLTESFWLSFGTIALIIYGMSGRLAARGWWWKWGRVQWVIGIGLMPLTFLLFQQGSLVSFLANSIAIPWLGLFILPFCFLSAVFLLWLPKVGAAFLFLADKSLALLWQVLVWFSALPLSAWHHAIPNLIVLVFTFLGFIILLLPAGFYGRFFGFFLLIPLFYYQAEKPAAGEVWLSVLDVGQGLAIVLQTKNHILVYDTGAKFYGGFDMGESVVLPYLYAAGVTRIDTLVVSHGDNDHIGGAEAILSALPVTAIYASTPEKLPKVAARYCLAAAPWYWDGVSFTFLYPTQQDLHTGNNSSCVLRIDTGSQQILLTGDIEKQAEKKLLATVAKQLPATLLIAPHHGSNTSGLKTFIQAVNPRFVVYATGYRNRYHFPHEKIIRAYDEIGATQLNLPDTGTMRFKLGKENKSLALPAKQTPFISVLHYRHTHKRYWYRTAIAQSSCYLCRVTTNQLP